MTAKRRRLNRSLLYVVATALVLVLTPQARAQPFVGPLWRTEPLTKIGWLAVRAGSVGLVAEDHAERRAARTGVLEAKLALGSGDRPYVESFRTGVQLAEHGPSCVRCDPDPDPGTAPALYPTTTGGSRRSLLAVDPFRPAVLWRAAATVVSQPSAGLVLAVEHYPAVPEHSATLREVSSGAVRWTGNLTTGVAFFDAYAVDQSSFYYVGADRWVEALDRRSFRRRWRARVQSASPRLARTSAQLYVYSSREVAALDLLTGRARWRRAPPSQAAPIVVGDAVAYESTTGRTTVVLGPTGAEWSFAGALIGTHGGRLVGRAASGALVVLDAASGRELARWQAPGAPSLDRVANGIVYGVTQEGDWSDRFDAEGTLQGTDLTTGRSWRYPHRVALRAPIVMTSGVLATCSSGGVIHAVDARSGAPLWRASVGLDGYGVCRLWASGGLLLAQGGDGGLSAFSPRAPAPPAPPLTISGRVLSGRRAARTRVRAADSWTRTDAAGRFQVTVASAGDVRVGVSQADAARLCAHPDVAIVDGAAAVRRAQVTLRLVPDRCICRPCE